VIKCEMCHGEEATIHLTQVVDGVVKKLHLCETCAAQSGFDVHGPMSITDLLLGMGGDDVPEPLQVRTSEAACPKCHMRRTDFKKSGRLGCPACYDSFSEELQPLIKAMHRRDQHTGKVPESEGERMRMTQARIHLQKRLDAAVRAEDYEQAARLRDEIKQMPSTGTPLSS